MDNSLSKYMTLVVAMGTAPQHQQRSPRDTLHYIELQSFVGLKTNKYKKVYWSHVVNPTQSLQFEFNLQLEKSFVHL